jgi:hypothetical protein
MTIIALAVPYFGLPEDIDWYPRHVQNHPTCNQKGRQHAS